MTEIELYKERNRYLENLTDSLKEELARSSGMVSVLRSTIQELNSTIQELRTQIKSYTDATLAKDEDLQKLKNQVKDLGKLIEKKSGNAIITTSRARKGRA